MQQSDWPRFETAMRRLCAGFDTPLTDARRDAYWRSFRKLTVLEFTGLVDLALEESSFASMPTVGALWDLHHRVQGASAPPPGQIMGPTLQEQLAEYVTRHGGPTGATTSAEVTFTGFVYRQWTDTSRPKHDQRCAECVGYLVEFADGTRRSWSVADMQASQTSFGLTA